MSRHILTDELLHTLHARAAGDGADADALAEDLADLAGAGFLRAAVPEELGGEGLSVHEVNLELRRLAYWARRRRVWWLCTCSGRARRRMCTVVGIAG
ncbi:hypothetical protein BJF85_08445 [Saccharomonospora sp. CUA-673]|uniref:hypothetical protein n=1 Tax=Saccharomonospora sp. CUA-673 TaxID=1904969 RepID=UPI00095E56C8|nr:hypothetical protein [Saccharomonospora sp. CUA-673]OLT38709.1 hypothetical protein BJF85_08445 [Saccharomonospora sp. CUA-673]